MVIYPNAPKKDSTMIRFISTIFLVLQISLFANMAQAAPKLGEAIRYLPVQDGGRIKPYDTFAKEVLEVVYGKKEMRIRVIHLIDIGVIQLNRHVLVTVNPFR